MGHVREDGAIFQSYKSNGIPNYLSPASFHLMKLHNALNGAKWRAKKKDIPFNLTIDHIKSIWPEDSTCPITGLVMEWGDDNGGRNTSPSLDRVEPEKGYTIGNVCWISTKANSTKRDSTEADLETILAYIRKHRGKKERA